MVIWYNMYEMKLVRLLAETCDQYYINIRMVMQSERIVLLLKLSAKVFKLKILSTDLSKFKLKIC